MLEKYNIGGGLQKIEGYLNIDIDPDMKPDIIHDITKPPIPVEENSAKQILFIHVIEHIDKWHHFNILMDLQRILHPQGVIYIAFPEFEKVAMNWITNHKGNRTYWEAAIFGRGGNTYDRHVAAMSSIEVQEMMLEVGFSNIKITPEPGQEF